MNYLAIGYDTPKLHQTLNCVRFNASNHTLELMLQNFSTLVSETIIANAIRSIDEIAPNIFKLRTKYDTYFYQISTVQNEITIPKTYIAFSKEIPKVGFHFECYQLRYNSRFPEHILTTEVKEIQAIETDIYKVSTLNSIYVVQILK